jgi:type VI protein secretion system component Hcp
MKKLGIWLAALAACMFVSLAAQAANTAIVRLKPYQATYLTVDALGSPKAGWMQVDDFAAAIEQTLNIGAQSTGAGAGKVTYHPMSFSTAPSSVDATLFTMAASGTAFEQIEVEILNGTNVVQLYRYKLAAIKTIAWVLDKTTGKMKVQYSFEYGGFHILTPMGGKTFAAGWDRVKNVKDTPTDLTIP